MTRWKIQQARKYDKVKNIIRWRDNEVEGVQWGEKYNKIESPMKEVENNTY